MSVARELGKEREDGAAWQIEVRPPEWRKRDADEEKRGREKGGEIGADIWVPYGRTASTPSERAM